MKFTKIAEDAFKKLQLNAGVLLNSFDEENGAKTRRVRKPYRRHAIFLRQYDEYFARAR